DEGQCHRDDVRCGAADDRRGCHAFRQDQCAGRARRQPELQPDLRHDQQSVGRHTYAWRLLRRIGGRAGRWADLHRCPGRPRVVDPQPGALLRHFRSQADPWSCDLSRYGFARMLTNFDIAVLGPLTRSATDLDLALDIMAGPDPDDGGYSKIVLPRCEKAEL